MPESIEVVTLFKDGIPIPKKFKLGKKIYEISKVNLSRAIKQGARRILVFSVSDTGGEHTLIFDTESLRWEMENQYSFS